MFQTDLSSKIDRTPHEQKLGTVTELPYMYLFEL